MKIQNQLSPIMTVENNATIYVSIELSRKSWLTAIHTPLADKIGLHKVEAGDSKELLALIRRIMKKVERSLPIRLTHLPTTCGMLPFPRVEFVKGRCADVASDAE